jgi:hypothetical protein
MELVTASATDRLFGDTSLNSGSVLVSFCGLLINTQQLDRRVNISGRTNAQLFLFPEDGQFWVGVLDDGIPRPSCKKSAQRGEDLSPECLSIDKGCPQMLISNGRDASVLRSPCEVQAGFICHLGSYALL